MPIKFHEGSKTFHIYNKHLSYITCIMENGQMENLYYGKAIRDKEDFSYLHEEIMRSLMAVCVPEPGLLSMQYTKQEYLFTEPVISEAPLLLFVRRTEVRS